MEISIKVLRRPVTHVAMNLDRRVAISGPLEGETTCVVELPHKGIHGQGGVLGFVG